MKRSVIFMVLLVALMTAGTVLAKRSVGMVKPSEPHGVVIGSVDRPAQGLFAVRFVAVDGEEIADRNQGLWLSPGEHKVLAYGNVDRSYVRGVKRDFTWGNYEPLTINVEEGRRYYVAAKADSSRRNEWELVVWKVE